MSDKHSSQTPWVDGLTIDQVLKQTVNENKDQDALVFTNLGHRNNWQEFYEEVEKTAKALLAMGIQKGEHVAIWATNVPEWVYLQFATARIGAVLVTVNPAYRPFELEYVLKQSDSVALFLVDRFKKSDYHKMVTEVCPALATSEPGKLSSDKFPKLRSVVSLKGDCLEGAYNWQDILEMGEGVTAEELATSEALPSPDEPINIQYTSGTTGFPKAATLSHRNLLLNAYYIGFCQKMTNADKICIPVPFYHCFGCVLGTLCCAVFGSTMVIPEEYFQPDKTLDAIEQEGATSLYGVPTMFIAQLEDETFSSRNLTTLRTGIMAGSPCPIEVMKQVIHEMGASEMTIAYGETEASPVITQTRTDDPLELRVETVGRALPDVEVKIVDPESGNELGDNEQGELCSRSAMVMIGYYGDKEATDAAIDKEGWLHTGDLAVRLPNGYFRITGRIKDMVIRGGENIYPREIEEFLFTHESIEQAAVVGLPDKKYGEELCVWIKLRGDQEMTPEEVQNFCRGKLAHYKVPRYVKFVTEFPQTVTGKIQKFKIRDIMKEELGLSEEQTA
ncbi:MAG: AMP-binding protein [Pirellulaceae bacterium]|nr:AMP-binding protein [Pirellulaceae bacterium]